ncbi:MAG: hypothetical protein K9L56_13530 [Clostridiales bacterium]|nr:hypothetical protein [Clostridiales bacterium]
MPISSRVDVTVMDQTPTESVPSFNIPLVLGTGGIPEIKDEVITLERFEDLPDAVDPTTKEYQVLQKIFAQSPHADKAYLYSFNRNDYSVAELTTGSGETEIVWRSKNEGDAATNIQVEIDPIDGHDLDSEFYKQMWVDSSGNTNYLVDKFDSDPTGAFKLQSKQPDYDQVLRFEVTTETSLTDVGISLSDSNGDGELDKITINVDDAGAHTIQDVVDAIEADSEASALFGTEVYGTGSTSISSAVAETNIPFTVRAIPETASDSTVNSTAEELAAEVNDTMTSDASLVVSASSDGTDTVSATGPSNLSATSDSPAEMVRALDHAMEKFESSDMDKPYFLVATTYGDSDYSNEVDGDRVELANAVSTRNMIYGTSNRDGESPTDARILAHTMATDRAFVFGYKSKYADGREWPEACLIGKWSGHDITVGQLFAPMWSPLNSLPEATYNATEQARLEGGAPLNSAAFTYAAAKDTPVVTGSWSTSGEYLDWRQQKDYIEELVERTVVAKLTSKAVVKGDSRGIAELQAAVEGAFSKLVSVGIIGVKEENGQEIPMYSLDFPSLDEWSELDRAERHYIASATVSPSWGIEAFDLTIYATLETDEF